MDNTQSQVIANFSSLFGRYKAVVTQNEREYSITVNKKTISVNKPRQKQTQLTSTKL